MHYMLFSGGGKTVFVLFFCPFHHCVTVVEAYNYSSLITALNMSQDGDLILLFDDSDCYGGPDPLLIHKNIVVRNGDPHPVVCTGFIIASRFVVFSGSMTLVSSFTLQPDAHLTLADGILLYRSDLTAFDRENTIILSNGSSIESNFVCTTRSCYCVRFVRVTNGNSSRRRPR